MSFLTQGIELPFANGFYSSRSRPLSIQRCINYYPWINQAPSLSPESLYMTPGIRSAIVGSAGFQNRGAALVNGVPYYVNGSKLYRLDISTDASNVQTYTEVEIDDIPGSSRVIMVPGRGASGYELVIVLPGDTAYSYELSSDTLTTLNGVTNFLAPVIDCVNINGFWIFLQSGTNVVFHSNLNDSGTYNALDFYTAIQTDDARAIMSYRGQLYVYGDKELIPFNYIGGANFVFNPASNANIPQGIRSLHGKINIRNAVCFLGSGYNEEPSVWIFQGGLPLKISTDAIDYLLQNLSSLDLDNAFFLSHSQNGSDFVVLIAGDECVCYDLSTGRWHERRSLISDSSRRWRVNSILQAENSVFVWDFVDGRIGVLDDQVFQEYDTSVQRSATLQPFDNKGKFVQVKDLMVITDSGYGAEMVLDWTDDDSVWSNGISASAGSTGEYNRIVSWNRMGTASFSRVIRISSSSNSKCNIHKVLAIA